MRHILDSRRSIRRYHRARLLRRRRHYWVYGTVFWPDPAPPSVVDTPKPCSCWMCGNPRRWRNGPRLTRQEMKFIQESQVEDDG